MLVIRLRRGGKTHQPHYRIVVQEKRSKVNGKYIESLGHFHPIAKEDSQLVINKDRILYWLGQGAKPSDTLTNLLVRADILPATAKISRVYSNKKKLAKDKSAREKAAPQAAKVETETKETESNEDDTLAEKSVSEDQTAENPPEQSEPSSKVKSTENDISSVESLKEENRKEKREKSSEESEAKTDR